MTPTTLDHAGIAARIPHAGTMCVLDRLLRWNESEVVCSATSHRSPDNPMRTAGGLRAPVLVEYAAQAMALHGGLLAPPGADATPGYLASVRAVRFDVLRIDDIDNALQVRATRLAGDMRQVMYGFEVHDDNGRLLAVGRATVVLNTPLPA
jgi:predicted hotdog family 3-hydroxylacyl-ACP dehydratase